MSVLQSEAGTSRSRTWHSLLRTSKDNNKAEMQQVPAIKETKRGAVTSSC